MDNTVNMMEEPNRDTMTNVNQLIPGNVGKGIRL